MKVWIDCDPGIDDALALLLALNRPEFEILGISTVAGNCSAAQGADNARRLLMLAGRSVPVCTGAEHPLTGRTTRYPSFIHGKNGLAELELPQADPMPEPDPDLLYETACRCGSELVLITLGRLTNLAQTIRRHPDFPGKIRRVVSMGGAVRCRGNITPAAEANLYGDPEAADLVFAAPWEVTLVGLDVTMQTRLTRRDLDLMQQNCPDTMRETVSALCRMLSFYMDHTGGRDSCPLHDPLAVLVAAQPQLVTEQKLWTWVDCSCGPDRGRVRTDPERIFGSRMVTHCVGVDAEAAVRTLLETFCENP